MEQRRGGAGMAPRRPLFALSRSVRFAGNQSTVIQDIRDGGMPFSRTMGEMDRLGFRHGVATGNRTASVLVRRLASDQFVQDPNAIFSGPNHERERFVDDKGNDRLKAMRYFRVHVEIGEGETTEVFANKLWEQIRSADAPDYNEVYDDDEQAYDILAAEMTGFGDPGERVADHKFGKQYVLDSISLHPVKLRDFNCVYESLCIIYFAIRFGKDPPQNVSTWGRFVMTMFIQETVEFQQVITNGTIMEMIKIFCDKYRIRVGFFNTHQCLEELDKIETLRQCEDGERHIPNYYIAYYNHHAIPVHIDRLTELKDIIQSIVQKEIKQYDSEIGERTFCLVPPLFIFYFYEITAVILGHVQLEDAFFHKAGIKPLHVLCCGENNHQQMSKKQNQNAFYTTWRRFPDQDRAFEERRDIVLGQTEKEQQRQLMEYEKLKKIMCPFYIGVNPTEDDFHTHLQSKIISRNDFFNDMGFAAIDIETCMDNSLTQSMYNVRPFMLHLHGRLKKRVTITLPTTQRVSSELVMVDTVFIGFDCCNKFIEYLLVEGFAWSDAEYKDLINNRPSQQKDASIYNYIFAHNGFGFDFLYLFEPMMKQMSGFTLVGDASKAKSYKGNGIFEYDFMHIYREPLAKLAKTFFPNREDLWKGECKAIIDMPIEEVNIMLASEDKTVMSERPGIGLVKLSEIAKYCRQDTVALYNIAHTFFGDLFTKPMGQGFVKKPVYHSLSAVAWDVVHHCFLKVPLFVNPFTQADEQRMKIGGLTVEYRHRCGYGLLIDVTSEYPSAMMNLMPVFYKKGLGQDAIERWPFQTLFSGRDKDILEKIVRHSIYYVRFKFPDTCRFPTISIRTDTTLIQPLMHSEFENEGEDGDWLPLWGDSIITALTCEPDCQMKVHKMIQFEGAFVYRDFIEFMFGNRMRAQKSVPKDELGDKFYKNMMNMAFGKFGQNNYAKAMVGSKSECIDHLNQIMQFYKVQDWKLRQLPTEQVPMYELKIQFRNDDLLNKGALVRFSSYIMEISRNHLMTMKHRLAKEFGNDCICYSDTDSIAVSFDKIDKSGTQATVQQFYDELIRARQAGNKSVEETSLKGLQYWLVDSNKYIKKIQELKIRDLTNLHTGAERTLIHPTDLGACKIEKFFVCGAFLAPKQYTLWCFYEGGHAAQMIKIKGVQQKYVTPQLFEEMMIPPRQQEQYVDQDTGLIVDHEFFRRQMPIAVIKTKQWRRMFTGVSIVDQVKLITFAHKKRRHDLSSFTSTPFKTKEEQVEYANKVNYRMKTIKSYEKKNNDKITEVFDAIMQTGSYRVGKMMEQYTSRLNTHAMKIQNELRDTLDESRKRFMIRLPKYRWGSVHETIMKMIMTDEEVVMSAIYIMPKVFSIVHKAIYVKKTAAKKGTSAIMNYDLSARVVTFCIYSQYILKLKNVEIPKNLNMICEGFKRIIMQYLGEDLLLSKDQQESDERLPSWQILIDWGLRFLAAPVAVIDYAKVKEILVYNVEDNVPLNKSLQITTLWMRYTQIMTGFLDDPLFISEEQADMEGLHCNEEIKIPDGINFDQLQNKLFSREIRFPVYDMRAEQYNYVSETHLMEGIYEEMDVMLGRRRDRAHIQDQYEVEQVMMRDGNAMPQVVENPKTLKENPVEIDNVMSRQFQLVFSTFMTQPDIRKICACEDDRIKIVSTLLSQENFPIKDEDLYTIFVSNKGKNGMKITRDHIIDFTLLFQFLYFGLNKAQFIIRRVMSDWSRLACVQDPVQIFIMAVRIVFQKPSMFPMVVAATRNMPKRLRLFFTLMQEFTGRDFEPCDEFVFRQALTTLVNNPEACDIKFSNVLLQSVTTNQLARTFGKKMTQKLLTWAEPTPEMIVKLKAILLSTAPVVMDTTHQEQIVVRARIQQLISADEWQKIIEDDIAGLSFNIYGQEQMVDRVMLEERKKEEEIFMRDHIQEVEQMQTDLANEYGHHIPQPSFRFERTVNLEKFKRNHQLVRRYREMTDRTSDACLADFIGERPDSEYEALYMAAGDADMIEKEMEDIRDANYCRMLQDDYAESDRLQDMIAEKQDRQKANKRRRLAQTYKLIEDEAVEGEPEEESPMELIDLDNAGFRERYYN